MSPEYEAAQEICSSMESLRQELDYIGKQLDGSDTARRRERIATECMAAIISKMPLCGDNSLFHGKYGAVEHTPEECAEAMRAVALSAVRYADALLAELDKPVDKPAE